MGRYVVEALLGRGGMGSVYRAYDETLRRRVALKLVEAGGAEDASTARRILREARMAAAFDHPNVVGIFDVGEHEGTPFIVMEHVAGRPLRAFVGGGVDVDRRLKWLVAIARALDAAHAAGLVHRDIKPENVMVREDGEVKVLDFGIAGPTGRAGVPLEAALAQTASTTFSTIEHGIIAGTPAYMAPELLTHGVFDGRTDQFAWGVLAFEILTGRHPFRSDGTARGIVQAIVETDPEPLDALTAGAPARVGSTIDRALARDPAARFASMGALLLGLGEKPAALPTHGLPVLSAAASIASTVDASAASVGGLAPAPAASKAARRRAWWAAGAIALSMGLGAAAVAFVLSRRDAPPPFEIREAHRLSFEATYAEYPSFAADGSMLAYDAAEGRKDQVYAFDLATNTHRLLVGGAGWHYAAALSPSGRDVAFLGDEGGPGAFVAPVDGATPPRRIADGKVRPTWAPGGAIWAGDPFRPRRFDAATGREQRVLEPMESLAYDYVIELPDGRIVGRIEAATNRGIGLALHEASGEARWLWKAPVGEGLAWIGGTEWLLASARNLSGAQEIWQVPLGRGQPRRVGGADVAPSAGLAISPAGDRIAWSTAQPKGSLHVLAPAPDDPAKLVASPLGERRQWDEGVVRSVAGTSRLLVVSNRSGIAQPWIVDVRGVIAPRHVAAGDGAVLEAAPSHDGAWIAYSTADRGIWVSALDGGGAPRRLTDVTTDRRPAFSRNGELLYFERHGADGQPEIRSVARAGGATSRVLGPGSSLPLPSPSDDTLVYFATDPAGGAQRLSVLDLATGQSRTPPVALPPGSYQAGNRSRDGSRIALISGATVLDVDLREGRVAGSFNAGTDDVSGVDYGPDGLVISLRLYDGDVWIAEGRFR